MKRCYNVLSVLALIAVLFLQPASAAQAQPARDQGTPPAEGQQAVEPVSRTDRIIVKYKEGTEVTTGDEQARAQAAADLSARIGVMLNYVRSMDDNAEVLYLGDRLPLNEVQAISDQLMTLPEVEYAEPDQIFKAALVPNDPRYGEQWHYSGLYGINAPAAWNITTGLATTVVAVVDTGITNHPEFSGRTVPGYDFIGNSFDGGWTANDGNGRDNNPSDPGDWVTFAEAQADPNCPESNSSWHGTHVAGTIAANSNNGVFVQTFNELGNQADIEFHLVVTC